MSLSSLYHAFFPGKPTYTDKDVPDLTGKVIVITGANTGVGKETAKILYSKNAKVYVMCRSEEKTAQAIESIKAAVPNSTGDLIYQHLDLSDLSSVKAAAEGFLSKEKELHLLINNAGVAFIRGRETKQGIEMHLGTNCVGPFLLTKLLVPTMEKTAANSPPASVRVLSTSSCNVLAGRPTKFMANIPKLKKKLPSQQYINSKVGNYLHAAEWARHLKSSGIVSLSLNPGNLDSDLYRDIPSIARWFIKRTFLFPQLYGAYPTLWAALAPEVTMEQSGRYVGAWSGFWDHRLPKALVDAGKPKSEGGSGVAGEFWDWTEDQIKPYV